MNLTTKVLIALVAGLALGIAISGATNPVLQSIPGLLEPIGTLWVNALRMTVIPLVVSAIVTGINSLPDTRSIGRIGGRALVLALIILVVAATFAVVVGPMVLSLLNVDPAAAASLRASVTASGGESAQSAAKIITLKQWMIDLVPSNPVKAAADGAMLPLIVFTVLFGMAVTRIRSAERDALLQVTQAVFQAALTLVRWVLAAAPLGVFALSVPLATKLGLAAAGAVVYYVVAVSAMCAAFTVLLYLLAWLVGRQSLRDFARACGPAQAVAFSARSSLAALPAMLEATDVVLHLPLAVRSFFIPLSVVTFRAGAAIAIPMGVLFVARLYGVDLSVQQLVTIALTSIVTTFSAPGIPGGSIIVMVPVLLSVGLPVEAVGLLLGVDTIPDMFRTTANVTADMSAATVLARHEPAVSFESAPLEAAIIA
jgi:Na+/H+-dicarboxylate symporter